jgi:hypothetical protein
MRARKTRELDTALRKKGFVPYEGNHTFYFLHVRGKKTSIRTKISHGATEYGLDLLGQMSKQLHLERAEFEQLVDCPVSHQDYVAMLVERGKLKGDSAA